MQASMYQGSACSAPPYVQASTTPGKYWDLTDGPKESSSGADQPAPANSEIQMMSPVNTSMLPSRWDRAWTSCWWSSVLWLGVGSSWNCTFTCLEELLYSSTI